jgi:hypothetical protein
MTWLSQSKRSVCPRNSVLRTVITTTCGVVSVLSLCCGLLVGGLLILAPSGGGFFPDLGMVVGIIVLAVGNLISCICNGICWWAGGRRRWLATALLLQSLFEILIMGWIVHAV